MCVCVCIPRAGAGALLVHNPSSTCSRAGGPLGPGWPLAVDGPGTVLSEFHTLSLSTPLKGKEIEIQEEKRKSFSYQCLDVLSEFYGLEKCPAPHLDTQTLAAAKTCTHPLCIKFQLIQAKTCFHTSPPFSMSKRNFFYMQYVQPCNSAML